MDLSSLTGDALLHLMNIIHPEDRFNLILAGVLPGFYKFTNCISITQRIPYFHVDFGLRKNTFCELEIRSLTIHREFYPCIIYHENELDVDYFRPSIKLKDLLTKLLQGGFLDNLHQLIIYGDWATHVQLFKRYLQKNCIRKLEIIELNAELDLINDARLLFNSLTQLRDLRIVVSCLRPCNLNLDLENELHSLFHQLERFKLCATIEGRAWSLLQLMTTWLASCTNLHLDCRNFVYDQSSHINPRLKLDDGLGKRLRTLELKYVVSDFTKWILGTYTKITKLQLLPDFELCDIRPEICNLKDLYSLAITTDNINELSRIYFNGRPVYNLHLVISKITLDKFKLLKTCATRLINFHLSWTSGVNISDILTVVCQWKTLQDVELDTQTEEIPDIEHLKSFINNMCKLRYLQITSHSSNPTKLEQLYLAFKDFLDVERPNFKFSFFKRQTWKCRITKYCFKLNAV